MKLQIVLSMLVLSVGTSYCRRPENLAGTDLFPDDVTITAELKTGRDSSKPVPVVIPTKVLNLAYGAELFTCGLQALYDLGEIVTLQEKPQKAGGGAAGGVAVAEARRTPEYQNVFRDETAKNLLKYEKCNPLVVLTRLLFWQVPGTSGLADFRVSTRCQEINKTDGQIDLEATMDSWAELITYTVALYKTIAVTQVRAKSAGKEPSYTAPACSIPLFTRAWGDFRDQKQNNVLLEGIEKTTLAALLCDCILWSEKNAFGNDFPLRILMAGVYALAGHDQKSIFYFYRKLSDAVVKIKILENEHVAAMHRAARLPAPFTHVSDADAGVATPASGEALIAYKALYAIRGAFEPIAYSRAAVQSASSTESVSFPDCFETMLRNIVLALLMNADGSFKADCARADVNDFLSTYPTMNHQASDAATNAWGALVSKVPNALYVTAGSYELEPSLVNMLFMLNHLFDLKIPELTRHVVAINPEQAARDVFIQKALRDVNAALQAKLATELSDVITLKEATNDSFGNKIFCTINAQGFALKAMIHVGSHGEIESVERSSESVALDCGPFGVLQCALTKTPQPALGWSNMALLKKNMPGAAIRNFIKVFQDYIASISEGEATTKKRTKIIYQYLTGMFLPIGVFYVLNDQGDFLMPLITMLVQNGVNKVYALAQAIAQGYIAEQNDIERKNDVRHQQALDLLKALIEKDQDNVTTAVVVAQAGIKSDSVYVQDSAVELLIALIKKGHGYDEAKKLATEGMASMKTDVRDLALDLFKVLLEKGQGFAEAEQAARKQSGDNLFITLAKESLQKALEAARAKQAGGVAS